MTWIVSAIHKDASVANVVWGLGFVLVRVSGVKMTEQAMPKNNPVYAKYVATTSAFIPWLSKKSG